MNDAPILLDTCAAIFISGGGQISEAALTALQKAHERPERVYVSPITAWEIGMLMARRKLTSPLPPDRWFQRLLEAPGMRLAEMSVDLLIASSFLPGDPPRDPADRIVVATAREQGFRLVTRDARILKYASHGHVLALAC
jgi:PIN domain nuclease of toxin-antitoxin system